MDASCAVRLARPVPASKFADGTLDLGTIQHQPRRTEDCRAVDDEVWDFIGDARARSADRRHSAPAPGASTWARRDLTVSGKGDVFIEEGAEIGANVVFDVAAGPILRPSRRRRVAVHASRSGRCTSEPDPRCCGDRVASSSIGDMCKVRGELSNTIFVGHSNKGHDGIRRPLLSRPLGQPRRADHHQQSQEHLRAGAALDAVGRARAPVMQFLGTLFGDHAKTGIGTMLSDGIGHRRRRQHIRERDAAEGRAAVLVGRIAAVRHVRAG